jgi:hypothetical protein
MWASQAVGGSTFPSIRSIHEHHGSVKGPWVAQLLVNQMKKKISGSTTATVAPLARSLHTSVLTGCFKDPVLSAFLHAVVQSLWPGRGLPQPQASGPGRNLRLRSLRAEAQAEPDEAPGPHPTEATGDGGGGAAVALPTEPSGSCTGVGVVAKEEEEEEEEDVVDVEPEWATA